MTPRFRSRLVGFAALVATAFAVGHAEEGDADRRVVRIPASAQSVGDPDAGREFLLYGDYLGSGFPWDLYTAMPGYRPGELNLLGREGRSAEAPRGMSVFTTSRGVEVISGANCFSCHASMLNGELVIGLGNSLADWTGDAPFPAGAMKALAAVRYGPASPEAQELDQFVRGIKALEGKTNTPFRGVNPAFRIEEVAAAHRNPHDLSWTDERVFEVSKRWVASDVPPLWNLRKKHALYYNGMGRGDFSKLIQQIGVVGVGDSTDSERINESMDDVVAYLMTLEPPDYPGEIDGALAAQGEAVFVQNCARCHGTYGPGGEYPNKLIPTSVVGTDPLYAQQMLRSELPRWYNESWFARSEPRTRTEPTLAYIAPPLDGVWCTAPYLHNGSVPTLEALLDSSERPTFWRRAFRDDDYDLDAVGWRYETVEAARDELTYDTTRPGYGAGGHTFGDDLNDAERRAVIEYLKTL